MSQVETTPVLGGDAEPCASCGVPMAPDQRYCLNCGTRGSERRVPADGVGVVPVPPMPPAVAGPPVPAFARFGGSWGVAALVLVALGVGVVIGSRGKETQVASRPPTVTIAAGAVGGAPAAGTLAPASSGAAADEWPDQDGFTVQLGELAAETDQTAADAAKAAASAKGAEAPGVLDAGAHGLTAGTLVLYDGVFDTRKQAATALKPLKGAYPDARVIKVAATGSAGAASGPASSAGAGSSSSSKPATVSKNDLKANENLDPAAFQKKSKKPPKTTALPGKPPPKDNAAPGGGSSAESIG